MPDVANARKYQRKMTDIESAYLKQIDAYRRETRRALLEIIDRDGVSRQAVTQMQKEVDYLGRKVSMLGGVASGEIRKTNANYLKKQIEVVKRVGLVDTVDIAPVLRLGEGAAKDATESYLTNESSWVSQLQTSLQVNAAKLRISNASKEEITNRLLSERLADGRASIWAASGNAAKSEETLNVWTMAGGLLGSYLSLFNETQTETQTVYKKQVIATIDERTTSCCLEAHGQIQDIDDPFELTGEPRFADEIQDPPFHWYCRTSETLYTEEFESVGITTDEMIDASKAELTAREDGSRQVIYPSSATSRR